MREKKNNAPYENGKKKKIRRSRFGVCIKFEDELYYITPNRSSHRIGPDEVERLKNSNIDPDKALSKVSI